LQQKDKRFAEEMFFLPGDTLDSELPASIHHLHPVLHIYLRRSTPYMIAEQRITGELKIKDPVTKLSEKTRTY
jgi:hypothetical protein